MKKVLSVCCAALLALPLTACGGNKPDTNAFPADTEPKPLAENSWETDMSLITIKWFVAFDWYAKTWNPGGNTSDAKLLEKTGITLEISSGDNDKLNALIAADSLPDLVTMDITASQRTLLENNGKVLPLEPLFEKYAPDVNIPKSQRNWYRNPNGNWYAVASYYYGPERTNDTFGGYLVTHNNNFARQDILREIGMTAEDLRTKDGFLDALRKVKPLTYNGIPIIPYTGWWTPFIAAQFGMDLEDASGNLLQPRRQPEWLEALKFANTLYREGLISDEEFTQNQAQRDQKVASGQVFSGTGTMTVQSPRQALYAYDTDALIVYAGQMQGGDAGKVPLLEGVASGGWTGTMITSNAKNVDRIAQFISYMSQEESTLDAAPDIGADTYDLINGKMVRKQKAIDAFESDFQTAKSKYLMNVEFFVDWTIIQKYTGDTPATIWEEQTMQIEKDKRIHVYDSKTFQAIIPEGGSDLAALKASLDAYYDMAEKQIIMASSEEECEAQYRQVIQTMENMGWAALEEYENNKFNEAKAKLGITLAWPRNTGGVQK
jgi:putative aldouronate transport system substrate-binding protein